MHKTKRIQKTGEAVLLLYAEYRLAEKMGRDGLKGEISTNRRERLVQNSEHSIIIHDKAEKR